MAYLNAERIKEAKEQLEKIRADRELVSILLAEDIRERDEATRLNRAKREGLKEGEEIGLKKGEEMGKEIGKKENRIEIACNMLKKGMNINIIAEITGLTINEIEAINKK